MAGTRERIITATGELFRRQGYNGTALKQVTEAAHAPFGSLYHFFPGGKEALAEAVITESGAAYRQLFEMIYDGAAGPAEAITDFFDAAAEVLEQTDFADACPIGTVALEVASTNEVLRRATDAVFGSWKDAVVVRLVARGLPTADADDLAVTLIASLEGAFMLSRAGKDAGPLRVVGRVMRSLVEERLSAPPQGRGPSRPRRGAAAPA